MRAGAEALHSARAIDSETLCVVCGSCDHWRATVLDLHFASMRSPRRMGTLSKFNRVCETTLKGNLILYARVYAVHPDRGETVSTVVCVSYTLGVSVDSVRVRPQVQVLTYGLCMSYMLSYLPSPSGA